MHQFNAECDPACEYLTAVHASLICISLQLSLSHFLYLPVFPSLASCLSSDFRNFPQRAAQVLRSTLDDVLTFPFASVPQAPDQNRKKHTFQNILVESID
ncbi:hypothetical protein XENOCAPTIV_028787 [Xenoophorus captivus]|uniref:Uncharacterized protein n=1 Tax=Xenoophorus captivus TaxID=1517983 RepID=A0ABV0RVM6_9TELE